MISSQDGNSSRTFKEKIAAYVIAVSVVCAFLIVYIVWRNFTCFPIVDVTQMNTDCSSVKFEINDLEIYNGYIYISGWAAQAEPIRSVNCSVALRDGSGNVRKMKTSLYSEEFSPNTGADVMENAGFRGHVNADILSENEIYDILLIYRNNNENILVDTKTRINSAGEIGDG